MQLFAAPWMVAHQAPLSLEFSRQEYWSGLPGDLSDPGIEPIVSYISFITRQILYYWATWEAIYYSIYD